MSPLDLQRIVDGELDHAARADMLRSLGEDVREWRALALALLEEQQWSQQVQRESFLSDEGGDLQASERAIRVAPQTTQSSPVSALNPMGRKASYGSPWFTALAASVLLGLGLASGVMLRSFQEGNLDSQAAIQGASTIRNAVARTDREPKLPMKMVLNGTGGDKTPRLEIPVVDASEIDPKTLWARDAQELSALQQRLKREGYRMEWEPRLYSGRLSDGRQVVVPVHNVALKSVGL